MASKDYDQNDNDYKSAEGAAKLEKAQQEEERDKEFQEALERSRRQVELEKQQEILKRQQEARDLRARKRQEQQEAEAEQQELRESMKKAKAESEREHELEILKSQQAARDLRSTKKQEQKAAHLKIAGDAYGFTPLHPTGSKEELEKASFEAAENRRMWQELEERGKVKRPHGPGSLRPAIVEKSERVFDKMLSLGGAVKEGTKKHIAASYSDMFKVPFQPRENIGTEKQIRRSQQPSPVISSMFGGVAQKRGSTPRGLLSMGAFAGTPTSLFAIKAKSAPKRKARPAKKTGRIATTRRNSLDDMLFF